MIGNLILVWILLLGFFHFSERIKPPVPFCKTFNIHHRKMKFKLKLCRILF